MDDDGLPNARPIAFSDSPRCQRSQSSVFSAAVNPRKYPCRIAIHSIFPCQDRVLRRPVEITAQSGHGAMSESCPLLEVKRISLRGCIERLHFEGTLGPLPLAPRTLGCHPGRTSHIRWHEQTPSHV